jgi:hypothetical protein
MDNERLAGRFLVLAVIISGLGFLAIFGIYIFF